MKFYEIKPFTRTPTYRINLDWNYLEDWIEHQDNKDLNLDPDFQRAHVWTKEQQIAYIEYALRGGASGKDIYFNHSGWMTSFEGELVLVDGKQRITAALAFLNNKIKAFGRYRKGYEGRIPAHAEFIVHINDLKTKEEVLTWYLEMNTGGTPHTDEEIDKVKNLLIKELT